jgi:hypothetical protein
MSVYTDGHTVRGYRIEQFSDAFAQLGIRSVRSVRSVRSEARSEAGSNASDVSNASVVENLKNDPAQEDLDHYRDVLARPIPPRLLGDDNFLDHLFAAFQAGQITEAEWHRGDRAHRFLTRGRAA